MPARPDLKIRQLSIHQLTPRPISVVVSFTVVNIGRASSPQIDPGVYVNAINPTPPPGQNEIRIQKSFGLHPLAPAMGHHFDVAFTIRELQQKRIRRIDIIVDPKYRVPETNEFNNYASISI